MVLLFSVSSCQSFGEQGWRSGESTRLPPMWPGFDSWTRRHMWVDFVVGSHPCSKGFFFLRVLRFFSSLLKKPTFQIPIQSGIRGPHVCQLKNCFVSPSLNKVNFTFLTSLTYSYCWVPCVDSSMHVYCLNFKFVPVLLH